MNPSTCLSNGGANSFRGDGHCRRLIVGTVDGIFVLTESEDEWNVTVRALEGCFVSAVTRLESGTLLAATHGLGVARSIDDGETWNWSNTGLEHFDLWSARSGLLQNRAVAFVGSMPAHLTMSQDDGLTWTTVPALREVPSFPKWFFPPPPRLGHIKEIVIHKDDLYVGIEVGALLVSRDFGQTFEDLHIDQNPQECDIHRLLINPHDPENMIAAVGLIGLMRSRDHGRTWTRDPILPNMEYPDAFVMHPDRPELLFLAAGFGWPPTWYRRKRAQGRLARSTDGGVTWERLLGGLPDGQRALYSALSIHVNGSDFQVFAVDTDGQVFESRDGGDRWKVIAEVEPVSKGEFYRAMAKGRPRIAGVDDIVVDKAAAERFASVI